jgi:hypothetical protein
MTAQAAFGITFLKRKQGCHIFLDPNIPNGENVPNGHKLYQTAISYTKRPYNIPNGRKIYQHYPFRGPPKFTQIGIFGSKICKPSGNTERKPDDL